jgi:hypothetical protein
MKLSTLPLTHAETLLWWSIFGIGFKKRGLRELGKGRKRKGLVIYFIAHVIPMVLCLKNCWWIDDDGGWRKAWERRRRVFVSEFCIQRVRSEVNECFVPLIVLLMFNTHYTLLFTTNLLHIFPTKFHSSTFLLLKEFGVLHHACNGTPHNCTQTPRTFAKLHIGEFKDFGSEFLHVPVTRIDA